MKICIIGNLNIFIYNFAKYFVEHKGFEVCLIARKRENLCNRDFSFIQIYYLESQSLVYKIIKIRQIIRKIHPDIVHTFYISRDAIAPLLFFQRKFKYICSVFGSDFYWGLNNINKRFIFKKIIAGTDKITFNSFQMKKDLIRQFPKLDSNKVRPIIWGVNFKLFNDINSKKINQKKKELNDLFLRITTLKNEIDKTIPKNKNDIKIYNNLVSQYNNLTNSVEILIKDYNEQVNLTNNCIDSYGF